jgi:cyclic beta-1,2-glucan synthetase
LQYALPFLKKSRGDYYFRESLSWKAFFLGKANSFFHGVPGYFALRTDLCDSDFEHVPEDSKLVDLAKNGIGLLNKKYASTDQSKFLMLHRPRRWNENQKKWMGYERKRGKLEEFGMVLEGHGLHLFSHFEGNTDILKKIKYVITLDTDTKLTPGSAHRLVGNLDHPLNRPQFDKNSKIVLKGYGLLQPRMGSVIPYGKSSVYFKIFNSEPGINPYTKLVSDLYQDFFDEGSFIGKGIYDLKSFQHLVSQRLPENRILSHDLIEGCIVRSGFVSDVILYEDQPQDFITDTFRHHRWTRGDWQIASWLFSVVPKFQNQTEVNMLSGLSKWKIFDNLRRSIVSVAALVLFVWIILFSKNSGKDLLLLLSIVFFPYFLGSLDQLIRSLIQGVLHVLLLPIQVFQNLDAILRTFYRLYISKNFLLEWTCYSSLKAIRNFKLRNYFRLFWYAPIFSIVMTVVYSLKTHEFTESSLILYLLLFFWGLSPLIAWWISKPQIENKKIIDESEKNYLILLALQISKYFTVFENQENNWLPPDNFQETPVQRVAHRTSPTNIGLSLISALASYDLGIIKTEELLLKIFRQFDTLKKMERYQGHFFNWYDTISLKPLLPCYVSTVDSGNFVASCIVLKQGLLEILKSSNSIEHQEQINSLLESLSLFTDANFTFLFDSSVKLFSIGFNVTDQRLDIGYYDLLASEARLTSYLAIVKGQVPMDHWFALGRSITCIKGKRTLLSWSGSMFEYLMPHLFMPLFRNTIIGESCSAAIDSQVDYGKLLGIPWGMSESGFSTTDQQFNYQYRAFGVPELGFKRDLQHELVIAPYASALVLSVDPHRAILNLKHLEREGFRGEYGFYEAIDYTGHRLSKGKKFSLIRSYMAHHQGMSLIAIVNLLKDDLMVRRFLADPEFKAYEILLQESIPDIKPVKAIEFDAVPISLEPSMLKGPAVREFIEVESKPIEAAVLSNGHYKVLFLSTGCGYSFCDKTALTPWRRQNRCSDGFFFYISDLNDDLNWSNSYYPTQINSKSSEVRFYDTSIEVLKHLGLIECKTIISISPVDNIELRSITLTNNSESVRHLKLTSYAEVVNGSNAAFVSHPTFSKLFVETEFYEQGNAIICQRRKRSSKDKKETLFHFYQCEDSHRIARVSFETDRMKFIGRNGSMAKPEILQDYSKSLSNTFGATLDPIVSIQCEVKLLSGQSTTIHFFMGVSENTQQAKKLIAKYSELSTCKRVSHMAWTHGQAIREQFGITEEESLLFNRLCGIIELPFQNNLNRELAFFDLKSKNISTIWQYGISGDRPIILLTVTSTKSSSLIVELLKAHRFLRHKGVLVDVILLSTEEISYRHEISDFLISLVSSVVKLDLIDQPEGIFVRRIGSIHESDRILLKFLSAISLIDSGGTLEEQLHKIEMDDLKARAVDDQVSHSLARVLQQAFPKVRDKRLRLRHPGERRELNARQVGDAERRPRTAIIDAAVHAQEELLVLAERTAAGEGAVVSGAVRRRMRTASLPPGQSAPELCLRVSSFLDLGGYDAPQLLRGRPEVEARGRRHQPDQALGLLEVCVAACDEHDPRAKDFPAHFDELVRVRRGGLDDQARVMGPLNADHGGRQVSCIQLGGGPEVGPDVSQRVCPRGGQGQATSRLLAQALGHGRHEVVRRHRLGQKGRDADLLGALEPADGRAVRHDDDM